MADARALVDRVQDLMETKGEEDVEVLCIEIYGDLTERGMKLVERARDVVYRRWTKQTREEMAVAHGKLHGG